MSYSASCPGYRYGSGTGFRRRPGEGPVLVFSPGVCPGKAAANRFARECHVFVNDPIAKGDHNDGSDEDTNEAGTENAPISFV